MKTDETVKTVKKKKKHVTAWSIFEHYKIIAADSNAFAMALLSMFLNYPQIDPIHEISIKKSSRHLGNRSQTSAQKRVQYKGLKHTKNCQERNVVIMDMILVRKMAGSFEKD